MLRVDLLQGDAFGGGGVVLEQRSEEKILSKGR